MNIEQIRLQTFSNWPQEAPVEAWRIAKGGFFATGNGLEVQCHWCGSKISEWEYGEPIMAKHRRLKPDCPFITNPTSSGNVPLNNVQPSTSEVASNATDLMNEHCRLATFTNWPVPFISATVLAKAGFYYFNLTDHVKCAWCQGVIAKWEIGDNPFTEHLRFFPNCPRAQLGPNVEIQSEESIRSLGIQQIRAPKKERYSSLDARLRSFTNWPRGSVQSPETLATAGFYYQNTDDQVLCFQCNGGLRSWQREDDAWFEHARWFPKCEFVQLVKGPQYIAQVQQQARQGLDEAMSGEPVQKALQLGLSEGRIRAVTKYHLERFGSPFKCAETLIDAVLDYQREEEQQQSLEDGDDDEEQSSSAIVREVGRILDTIFNNNHDSTPTLLSNGGGVSNRDVGDDFVLPETSSQSSQSGVHSVALPSLPSLSSLSSTSSALATHSSPRTTDTTTSTANNSTVQRAHRSISPQKESTASIPNDVSGNAEMRVPEACTNEAEGAASNAMCSSNGTNDNASSSSSSGSTSRTTSTGTTTVNSTAAPKKMTLEEENRQLKDARLCKVCMDDDVAVVFLPCGHLVTCVQCAPSVTACPLCRTAIKAFVRTFLS